MKFMYFQDTDSFAVKLGDREYQHSATVSYDFFVELDWDELIFGIECLDAQRHLDIDNISANAPAYKWITLADDEPVPRRTSSRVRYFIHRPAQDTVYIEFALGEPVTTEPVIDGVHAEVNAAGAAAGLHIANASRNLDLDSILASGTPVIEWEQYSAPVATGIAAG